jgi:hypothetical protein
MTEFTPLAGREKIKELTDFNFSCITRLFSCTTESDIMPSAWRQYQEELPGQQAREDAFDQCKVPLEFFGREDENIAIVEVMSVHAAPAQFGPQLAARMRVTKFLKGQIQLPLNKPQDAPVYDREGSTERWNSRDLLAGHRYILLADIAKDQSGENEVAINDCGVVPYSDANLSAIQQGIDESLVRRIPER